MPRTHRAAVGLVWVTVWWIRLLGWTGGTQHGVVVVSAAWSIPSMRNGGGRSPGSGSPDESPRPLDRDKLRIRRTQAADLPQVAQLLAAASVSRPTNKAKNGQSTSSLVGMPSWGGFQSRMDELWAKADIESLLSSRYQALREGQKAHGRVQRLLNGLDPDERRRWTESDVVRLLWTQTSPTFRTQLEKAAFETGEDNVWRSHNVHLPPPSASWLRHLQLTAVAGGGREEEVVAFCEVAVLWNPCLQTYTPAIANLATAVRWRRRGVATRLLRTALRYVALHWKDDDHRKSGTETARPSLGLFVEKDNLEALALYKKLGFEAAMTCDGGAQLGEMWYMSNSLDRGSKQTQTISTATHEAARR